MGKAIRLDERRQAIVAALEAAGQLSVVDLSERLRVSEVTIRSDLQALSEQGLLHRTRGAALSTTMLPELSHELRVHQQPDKKARIGRLAATLVRNGDTIAIDASTTAQAIIPYIKHRSELTVITNSLKAAMSLLGTPHIDVILPGGSLRHGTASLVGEFDRGWLDSVQMRIGFFGAHGLTLREGLTDINLEEVGMKRTLAERCQRVVAMVDARKFGQVGAATFAELEMIDIVVADDAAPAQMLESLRRRGVEVLVA